MAVDTRTIGQLDLRTTLLTTDLLEIESADGLSRHTTVADVIGLVTATGITTLNSDTATVQTLTGGDGIDITDVTPNHSFAVDSTVARSTDNLSFFATTTSAQLLALLSDETGTGSAVFGTSPTLVTPALGTPSSIVLTSGTGLPLTTGVTGTLPVANGGTGVTTSTGTGNVVLSTSPTIVTPTIASFLNATHSHLNAAGGGTITAAAISDFSTAVAATSSVTANTAKVTNATHTGDVTGSTALTIASGVVTLANMADIATSRFIGRVTAATGVPEALTGTQATTLLDTFTSALQGLVPASGGGTTNFLRADGSFAAPAGGGDMVLADIQTVTGAKTFNNGKFILAGSTSGTTTINAAAVAGTTTIAFPGTSGTVVITGLASQITIGTEVTGASTALTDTANLARTTTANTFGAFLNSFVTSSMRIPLSATPTMAVDGDFAIDTTVTDFSHGIMKFFDGEEIGVVSMPIAQFTTPTDGTVVAYNATNDEFELIAAGAGDMILASAQVVTGTKTFDSGTLILSGATSGTTIFNAAAVAGTTTVTLQGVTGTVALLGDNLGAFASTTSAQLLGVISDETGTGSLVFGTSPTLVTPLLGTPTSGVATNLTGLPLTTGVTGILPSANMDSDTAHLTTTQTFSGSKTFTPLASFTGGIDILGANVDNIQNAIYDTSTSGTDIDFSEDDVQSISIAVNTTFTTASRVLGKNKILKITTDATLRTLTFPAWKFIGTKPTDQAASKVALLSLVCYGTADTDIVASYAVEA